MTTSLIRTESLTIGGKDFTRTYSDAGRYVVRDGISYDEAIDPAELGRTYVEGAPITTDEAEELLNILTGEVE